MFIKEKTHYEEKSGTYWEEYFIWSQSIKGYILYHITSIWNLTFEATETKGPDRGKVEREFDHSPDELF